MTVSNCVICFFRHGRRFAHFTDEGKDMSHGLLSPVFRLRRKREANEGTDVRM